MITRGKRMKEKRERERERNDADTTPRLSLVASL